MSFGSPPLFVFIIISSVPSWRIMKLFLTWPLTMMSTVVTIFRKGRLCSVVHGQYERIWALFCVLTVFCLGPYCMTPRFLIIPWSITLNGIWRMEISIQIWWTGTLWHLVLDAGECVQHILRYISHWASSWTAGRICPGRHLSDDSLYLIASCLLAVYDIKPPVDDQGNVIELKPEFSNGFLT